MKTAIIIYFIINIVLSLPSVIVFWFKENKNKFLKDFIPLLLFGSIYISCVKFSELTNLLIDKIFPEKNTDNTNDL